MSRCLADLAIKPVALGASDLVMMDAVALSRAIQSRQVSCVEVMAAYLDHIERVNPLVNAIVSLQDRSDLVQQAQERDSQLARGECLGWMHGFPQAVKDLSPTKGIRTTQGSLMFKDHVPRSDAIFVERIKRAGGIVIGKTNTAEFGLGSQTYNAVFGTTLNAYDQAKTAGGSSGGAAVAVALRMLPVADGGDSAGSLRNPAAFNNILGFRPSPGCVPSEGREVCLPPLGVVGPMARNVRDLAMLLSVTAGYDRRALFSTRDRQEQFATPLECNLEGKRVGYLGDCGGYLPFEPGVLDLCGQALDVFEHLGCKVESATPDYDLHTLWQSWLTLRFWQTGGALKDRYQDPLKRAMMKPEAQWEVEGGLRLTGYEVFDASVARIAWIKAVDRLFKIYDFLLLPTAQVFPFDAQMHWPREINGHAMDTYHRWMEVVLPATMAGCPALSIPAGFNDQGLPMGLQIIGPRNSDLTCLQLAYAYENATSWIENRPSLLLDPEFRDTRRR